DGGEIFRSVERLDPDPFRRQPVEAVERLALELGARLAGPILEGFCRKFVLVGHRPLLRGTIIRRRWLRRLFRPLSARRPFEKPDASSLPRPRRVPTVPTGSSGVAIPLPLPARSSPRQRQRTCAFRAERAHAATT